MWGYARAVLGRRLCLILCASLVTLPALGRSLSLDEALELAEQHDQRLDVTRAAGDASSARALQETARVLPSLEVGASVTRNAKEVSTGGRVVTPLTQTQSNLVGRLTLFDGPSVPGAIAGWWEHEASELERMEQRDALRAEVAELYLTLAEAQSLEKARVEALETAEELLRLAEARVRFSEGILLEVEEARAEVLRATAEVATARGIVRQTEAILALRLGLPPGTALEASCDACVPPPVEEGQAAHEQQLELPERQDLRGLDLRVDAALLRSVGSWLDFLPDLSVVGTARLQEPTLFNPDPVWWSAQLVASWTLFEGGGRLGRLNERGALRRRAELEAELALREANVAVHQAKVALEAASASDQAARARAEVAKSALELAKLRYREGLLSSHGVSEAARRKADADAQAVTGRFSVERATLRLRRALGLGPLGKGEQTG